MLHLGSRAFDSIGGEVVSSTAFTLENVPPEARSVDFKRAGTFIRLVEGTSEAEKVAALSTALEVRSTETGFHLASDADFAAIPGSPIVYWLSEKMRAAFKAGKPLGEVAELRQGLKTANNDRFLRQWWEEVSKGRSAFGCASRQNAACTGARWFPYNKGGEFRRWYGNQEFVVNWEHDGAELRAFGTENGSRPKSRVQATEFYFKHSISWPEVSSGAAAFRYFPKGFVFDSTGSSGFTNDPLRMAAVLSIANSSFSSSVLEAVAPGLRFDVGQIAKIPVLDGAAVDETEARTAALIKTATEDWDVAETSWNFQASPLVERL